LTVSSVEPSFGPTRVVANNWRTIPSSSGDLR
jgi:hypothetical protein